MAQPDPIVFVIPVSKQRQPRQRLQTRLRSASKSSDSVILEGLGNVKTHVADGWHLLNLVFQLAKRDSYLEHLRLRGFSVKGC